MFIDEVSVTTNRWVVCPQPNSEARLRLFCFPYAGAGAAIYHSWGRLLSPKIEVFSIRLPGREGRLREESYIHLVPLVEDLVEALYPYFDQPFAFFGHSLGALISFEVARKARKLYGLEPVHLFVSGRRAPQLLDPDPPLRHLPDAAFIEELQRRYDGIPQVVLEDNELMNLFLPVLRVDLTVLETYQYIPEAPLGCPITAFGGQQDKRTSQPELVAWSDQTHNTFRLQFFPGGHFFLQSTQSLLFSELNKDLNKFLS